MAGDPAINTLVLIGLLVLHLSGLWPHVPQHVRTTLTSAAATQSTLAAATPVAPVALPVETASPAPLELEPTASAFAIDAASGQILVSHNADKPRPIASVTKMMTSIVALSKLSPSDTVTIGKLPAYRQVDETMGLVEGTKLSAGDLVKAALIPSANDAADSLAIATSGSVPAFIAAMNAKLAEWGITDAHFASASGLTDTGNEVSASSITKIAQLALTNSFIRESVNETTLTVRDNTGRTFNLTTTNNLLAASDFYGIKTGYTEAAGQCFVGLAKVDGHEVITVILGSEDRFGQTRQLVNWIGTNWTWL